jgi:hypothetical protein
MKGELYGMLFPQNNSSGLKNVLIFAYNESMMAHRGIGIMGELFIAAMISLAIEYEPLNKQIEMTLSEVDTEEGIVSKKYPVSGIAAELILNDLKRVIISLKEFNSSSIWNNLSNFIRIIGNLSSMMI